MLKDSLRCLKQLSLYLQSQEDNILNASSHIDKTINELQALKEMKLVIITKRKSDENDDEADDMDDAGANSGKQDVQLSSEAVEDSRKIKGTCLGQF